MPTIINIDQTGFVLAHQTHDNIITSLQIIRHISQNKIEAMLISLDAEKAFNLSEMDIFISGYGKNMALIM